MNNNIRIIDIIKDFERGFDNRYKYLNRDKNKIEDIILKYYDEDVFQKTVISLAKKHLKDSTLLSNKEFMNDLFMEAKYGLIEAASKYDEEKHISFMTYAYIYIRKYVFNLIRNFMEKYKYHTSLGGLDIEFKDDFDEERVEGRQQSKIEKNYLTKYGSSFKTDITDELEYNLDELFDVINIYYQKKREKNTLLRIYVMLDYFLEDDLEDFLEKYDKLEFVSDLKKNLDLYKQKTEKFGVSYKSSIKNNIINDIVDFLENYTK